ncbi:MAG: alpha-glucosidase/alpha-galactosidase [Lachnospiraceae bacterium]|nr:alpha-glucosidase/alpha-galactosidase [Lachnospiraceae bacterium]
MKIAFIGAGSVQFTTKVVKDLVTYPAFDDAEICLMDINEDHLNKIEKCVQRIKEEMKSGIRITRTMDRAEALSGADGVLCTVFNGDVDIWRHEILIPKKYGVDINVGDTRSVSGLFRALRNIPLMLDICHDIEKYCPKAIFLNYTNPMAMLCKAMLTYTKVDVTGLCHSVQGTTEMLAEWAGADYDKVKYTCIGVNHQAFITEITEDGKDLYPIIREKIADPEFNKKEKVRNEIFRMFGYYVTESSGHNSEYCAWFRKRPDLIRKYCNEDGANWNPGEYAYSLNLRSDPNRYDNLIKDFMEAPIDHARGKEYAANIFNARLGDKTPFPFNANLLNNGTIENLPYDACVEIPVIATPEGYTRTFQGKLPAGPAALVNYTANIENLLVEACMEKNKQKVYQAVALDPLCSAVLSLQEVKEMCDEIFAANGEYLADYK